MPAFSTVFFEPSHKLPLHPNTACTLRNTNIEPQQPLTEVGACTVLRTQGCDVGGLESFLTSTFLHAGAGSTHKQNKVGSRRNPSLVC